MWRDVDVFSGMLPDIPPYPRRPVGIRKPSAEHYIDFMGFRLDWRPMLTCSIWTVFPENIVSIDLISLCSANFLNFR